LDDFKKREARKDGDAKIEAHLLVVRRAAERHREILEIFAALVPWIGCAQLSAASGDKGQKYNVLQLQGCRVAPLAGKRGEATLSDQLQAFRGKVCGRAREAFCALIAVMSSHPEMSWLDAYDDEEPARGYFAHSLVDPRSIFRIACLSHRQVVRPASLLLIRKLSLRDALAQMDYDGPLRYMPDSKSGENEYEYGLQELELTNELGERGTLPEERQPVCQLGAEPRFQALLDQNKPASVILIDAFAALTPRSKVSKKGLERDVLHAEMLKLLCDAKAEGYAVVFQIGGNNPHMLARKVYLRPSFAQFGLKCGYLRWRNHGEPWGKEQNCSNRACLGIQLP
jgi:hypothetical protein